jgi:hypothetical protein
MSALTEDELIERIKAHIEKGDQAKDKSDQAKGKAEEHYISAGILLKGLRKDSPSKAAWEKLVKSKCGIGTSRAYDLIAIADRRKTVDDVRLGTAERMRKLRSRPSRDGQNLPAKVDPDDGAERDGSYFEPEPKIEPEPEPVTAAAPTEEIVEAGIDHLASRLIDLDCDTAIELYRLLYDGGHGPFILMHALERGLKGHFGEYPWIKRETESAPSAPAVVDDGLDIPACLLRTPKDAAA